MNMESRLRLNIQVWSLCRHIKAPHVRRHIPAPAPLYFHTGGAYFIVSSSHVLTTADSNSGIQQVVHLPQGSPILLLSQHLHKTRYYWRQASTFFSTLVSFSPLYLFFHV